MSHSDLSTISYLLSHINRPIKMSKFDKTAGLPLAKRAKLGIPDAQKQALRAYWS